MPVLFFNYINSFRPIAHIVPLISLMLFVVPSCYTQQQLKDTIPIDEVMVTGTKVAVTRNQLPMSISVVHKDEIEASSESALLPVLSEHVPGLFVTERGITGFGVATGAAGQINMRGIGGSPTTEVLVLLNGSPQFMGLFGHPLPDAYVASDVHRVEVIRGPASTLYGSNAMGGVINIITKENQEDGVHANARAMYGSYNTQKYMANVGIKKDKWNGFVSFNHDQTDGHRDNSDFNMNNGYGKLDYAITPNLKAGIDFSLAKFSATDPGLDTSDAVPPVAGASIDILRGMGSFVLDNKHTKTEGSVRIFYNFGDHEISDGFHSNDLNFGLNVYQGVKFTQNNTVTFGFDFKKYGGIAENTLAMNGAGMRFVDTTVKELAGYALLQQILFNNFTIQAGFRLDHNEFYGTEPVPSAGIAWSPSANTSLKGSVSKGFRSPTIRELFMWGIANQDLLPERMINYDLSYKQVMAQHGISFELSIFHANGSNLIQTITSYGTTKYQNSGTFSNTGIETAFSYQMDQNLKFLMNYSYLQMKEPILASPEHKLFLSGTYTINKFSVNLNIQTIGNLYLIIGNTPLTESYTLFNARVAYKIKDFASIFVKGQNLTNSRYQINYGYPMPGIIGFGGINITL